MNLINIIKNLAHNMIHPRFIPGPTCHDQHLSSTIHYLSSHRLSSNVHRPQSPAYTLIEILLSIGLISMISFISIPVFQTFQFSNELDSGVELTAKIIRSAQTMAASSMNDSNWGVRVASSTVTIFKGNTYATRDTAYDVNYTLRGQISTGGLSEIVFSKLTGNTTNTGTINLSKNSVTRQLIINGKGAITFN